ncbi:MAG: protoporphyrinogen oxidase HemJ [Chromatiales bacterium]|jgi:putative membrane protein|nr:protoporphyrinogen oxidase HemJ [Chromatiales bacterium]MDX9767181.1 protoporphyrinogen oxidase HemJ [Ectothiorhodospiraceae bacterium]
MTYLWLKTFHIVFLVTWFAGLFYLPRLFVYHAMDQARATVELFKVMERRLFIMMTIGGVLTFVFGLALIFTNPGHYLSSGWLHAKLLLVALLIAYHVYCWKIVRTFAADANTRNDRWYRMFNEAPSLALIVIVILAVLKPF